MLKFTFQKCQSKMTTPANPAPDSQPLAIAIDNSNKTEATGHDTDDSESKLKTVIY